MKHERSVAEECADALLGRGIVVDVLRLERVADDLSVLSAVVSDLARRRVLGVTGRILAARKGVEMG